MKLKIIGGDTDSLFIKIPCKCNTNKAKKIADIITTKMSEILPPPMQLSFEAYGERGIFLAKKRYAIRLVDGDKYKLKMRGIETRRRDFTPFTTETLEEIINILLTTGDKKAAAVYAHSRLDKIKKLSNVNEEPELMQKLLLTKRISKPIEEYAGAMPHINAIKRAVDRGEPLPPVGERVAYYVVEGRSKNISDKTELADYVMENNLPICKSYYVDKQLYPPIKRIFDAMDFNLLKMKTNSKQKTLFDL